MEKGADARTLSAEIFENCENFWYVEDYYQNPTLTQLMYDDLYLNNVQKAGIEMLMYERYIDDSNQVAVVPPPGSMYDAVSKKVVMDEHMIKIHEKEDERLATILIEIANSVTPGITMEYDAPSKNADSKMPILDMIVWMEESS